MPAFLVLALLLLLASPAAAEVDGEARVIDANTLAIAGERVRLAGIDAPDLDQTCETRRGRAYDCGAIAARVLADLVRGERVACEGGGRDSTGRLVAVCRLGRLDLGEQMVLSGWALAAPADGAYARAEAAARGVQEGMWKGRFLPPSDWRRRAAPPAEAGKP